MRWLILLSLAVLVVMTTPAPSFAVGDALVRVEGGAVEGVRAADGSVAYLGMRYAAAPTGGLRWTPPVAEPAWHGVYHADRLGAECIQPLRRHDLNHYFGEEATSEDCLFINVWTPAKPKAAKLPVIVFIHGGGFTIGSSGMALYSGQALAARGVIAVNFNYRLGALGFFAHPELLSGGGSGNFGLMDQVAALGWVKRNIAAFGGDPDRVLISGQSAGAISVAWLEESGQGKGMFARAAVMSGPPRGMFKPLDVTTAKANALALQKAVAAATLDEMRLVPADQILAVQADCQLGCRGSIRFAPYEDGRFILSGDREALLGATPTLLGHTRDESLAFFGGALGRPKDVEQYRAAIKSAFGPAAETVLGLYPAHTPAEVGAALSKIAKERGLERFDLDFAARLQAAGHPVYLYEFARRHPYSADAHLRDQDPRTIGVYHTSDTPYWLGTLEALNLQHHSRDWTEDDRTLSRDMQDALISFAGSGHPALSKAAWPVWSSADPAFEVFGDGIKTERTDFDRKHQVDALPPPISAAGDAATAARPRD